MPNYKHMLQILLTNGETVFAMTVTDTDEMPMAFSSFVSAMHRPAEAGGVWRAAIPEFGARRNDVELDRWIHTVNIAHVVRYAIRTELTDDPADEYLGVTVLRPERKKSSGV